MKDFLKSYGSYLIWVIVVVYYFIVGGEENKTLMFDTKVQKTEVVTHPKNVAAHKLIFNGIKDDLKEIKEGQITIQSDIKELLKK